MTTNTSPLDTHDFTANPYLQDKNNLFAAVGDANQLKPFISFKPLGGCTATASGQAIILYVVSGEASYSDSNGKQGTLKQGGWCWIIAGSGIRYTIEPITADYQSMELRVALTPALENSPPQTACREPEPATPQLLLGWHGKNRSDFATPSQVNYLVVRLNAHQDWDYELPLNHKFAWVAVVSGEVTTTSGKILSGNMKVFNHPTTKIECRAHSSSMLVVGSSMEFGYDLLFHQESIHTSLEALRQGLKGISDLATS